jgi:DNA-binding CsgD family transcriptional regulator
MPAINLTPREAAVAQGLAQGLQNKQIARELNVSDSTVKVHVRHMMKKTKTANRTALMLSLAERSIQITPITDSDVQIAVADEREECAEICDNLLKFFRDFGAPHAQVIAVVENVAKLIRERGEK